VPLLEVDSVSVRFGGLMALAEVSFEADADRVTGLIGPNGAGKTTLFNAICGLQPIRSGRVRLDSADITRLSPHKRARRGLARTFQRLEIFGSLSVRENVLVAAEIHRRWSDSTDDPQAVADEILDRLTLRDIGDALVDVLPIGMARVVEVGRALATRPRVLLLDEPSSGLDPAETAWLGGVLEGLAADGLAVVLVEHDVGLVMQTSAQVYALEFGRIIASGTPDEVRGNEAVQAAYLGSTFAAATSESARSGGGGDSGAL
jgi:branched-chain amino acid transport system ATP-binding protein